VTIPSPAHVTQIGHSRYLLLSLRSAPIVERNARLLLSAINLLRGGACGSIRAAVLPRPWAVWGRVLILSCMTGRHSSSARPPALPSHGHLPPDVSASSATQTTSRRRSWDVQRSADSLHGTANVRFDGQRSPPRGDPGTATGTTYRRHAVAWAHAFCCFFPFFFDLYCCIHCNHDEHDSLLRSTRMHVSSTSRVAIAAHGSMHRRW